MIKPYIKICGIKTNEMAAYTLEQGASHIGIIQAKESRRFVDINIAISIAETTNKLGGIAVPVFTESDQEQIKKTCRQLNTKYAQLHGKLSRSCQHLLPDDIHRIYAVSVSPEGDILADMGKLCRQLDASRDMLLFDGMVAGSGQAFNHKRFEYNGPLSFFVAGGITPENAKQTLVTTGATGIDTSSGVENTTGDKDQAKIQTLIRSLLC